jgi:hypothetical protein
LYDSTQQRLAPAGTAVSDSAGGAQVRVLTLTRPTRDRQALQTLALPRQEAPLQARMEAVWQLAEAANSAAIAPLKKVAWDRHEPPPLRAEAVLALANQSSETVAALAELLDDPAQAVQIEAARALRRATAQPGVRERLQRTLLAVGDAPQHRLLADQLLMALHPPGVPSVAPEPERSARPTTPEEWRQALAEDGDAAGGRRVFYHPAIGCAKCHRIEDHGGQVGPDLSTIARASDRAKLIQSILNPSQDVAPQFVQHWIETRDKETYNGLVAEQSAAGTLTLITGDGQAVLVPKQQILSDQLSAVSLMPAGLEQGMTVQDFRDLLAFLLSRK